MLIEQALLISVWAFGESTPNKFKINMVTSFLPYIFLYSLLHIQSAWEVRLSSSKGLPYFFNTETKQSSWDAPPDLSEEQIQQLPGAKKYLGKSAGQPSQVRASHLLVKHRGSRRPSSWKEV